MRHGFPTARFHQALLEGWTLTDGAGVVDTVTDQTDGSCDIVTAAIIGSFTLKLPIKDFLGGLPDPDGSFTTWAYCRMITGVAAFDYVSVGLSDDVAGNAIFGGPRVNGDLFMAAFGASGASGGTACDRVVIPFVSHGGQNQSIAYGYGYDSASPPAYVKTRGQTSAVQAFAPSHLYVQLNNSTAIVQTLSVEVGFFVAPSVPDFLSNTPRA